MADAGDVATAIVVLFVSIPFVLVGVIASASVVDRLLRALERRLWRWAIVAAITMAGLLALALDARAQLSGIASWYDEDLGTASGERFDPEAMTAAHRTLPFGTVVRVACQRSGRSVTVRINDRGPAAWTGRMIDLSRGAARVIGMLEAGVVPVEIEMLSQPSGAAKGRGPK